MIVTFVTQADQNGIDSQWNLFFTDLDELSEYEQHRPTNDIAITENLCLSYSKEFRYQVVGFDTNFYC